MVNTTQHLPSRLRKTTERTAITWSKPGFELRTLRIRVQCNEFGSALCSVLSISLSETALYSRQGWNKSLHVQPLQRCYCENSGCPASACIMRRHYSITYTQSLQAISGLLTVRLTVHVIDDNYF